MPVLSDIPGGFVNLTGFVLFLPVSIFRFSLLYGGVFDALRKSGVGQVILEIIYTTEYLSLALALFNLIPIPPLDGSKVLFSLLPDRAYGKLLRYERYGSILLLLIVVLGVTRGPLQQATSYLVQQFLHISVWMNSLISGLVNR